MINKRYFLLTLTAGLLSLSAAFPAMAGSWKTGAGSNASRWWYDNGDNTWAANGWRWIDGNQDGVSECYYFDVDGWLLTSTTTPDGYTVNANGAWTVNGIVQTKQNTTASADEESWEDFQNRSSKSSDSSKKSTRKVTHPVSTVASDDGTSESSSSDESSSSSDDRSNGTSGSHSTSGSSGPSRETSSSSGDKKPDAPKKTSKKEPDSSYRQGSVTDEEIQNNRASDSTEN